jgi:hypothetical protein
VALHERRQREFREYQESEKDKTPGVYIVHTRWLHQWRSFVLNEDMHNGRGTWQGVQPPGPITNDQLFEKPKEGDDPDAPPVLKTSLRKVSMYRGVNSAMWKFFSETYGCKGAVIRRATMDIYSEPLPLDDDENGGGDQQPQVLDEEENSARNSA